MRVRTFSVKQRVCSRRLSVLNSACHVVELLERRTLLAAVAWDGGGDKMNWSDALNWSTDAVPGAADDVTIDVPTSPTVIYAGNQASIHSLVNRETLWVRGDSSFGSASASVSGNVTNDGTIRLETIDSPSYSKT